MLIDRENRAEHMPWILIAVLATVAASIWFFVAAFGSPEWPGGSSLPGFTFGVLGGVIILFEMLLWWRKKVRRWHIGRTKVWMSAHIWLGLLCVPLLVYHSGFRLGGTLSSLLMVLFLLVIASGIWGLILQQILPQRMLIELPAETIYGQIDHVASQLAAEAEQLVLATCGPDEEDLAAREKEKEKVAELTAVGHLTVGVVRSAGRIQGKVLQSRVPRLLTGEAEVLRRFFQNEVESFLTQGSRSRSPLQHATQAATIFVEMKARMDPGAYETLDTLESLCDQRRQLDRQRRMHFWLHSWLAVHLPLSLALTALMVVHAWVAVKYW